MKIAAIVFAFIVIGVCSFFLVRWTIQIVRRIKERKNDHKKEKEERKEGD